MIDDVENEYLIIEEHEEQINEDKNGKTEEPDETQISEEKNRNPEEVQINEEKKKKKKKKKKQKLNETKEEIIENIDIKNEQKLSVTPVPKITIDDCYALGASINCILLSTKFVNIRSPLTWICSCGNKFSESYININCFHRGCLKCSYKKFNAKNKK